MAVNQTITVSGSVTSGPPSASATFPTLSKSLSLADSQSLSAGECAARSIASPATFVNLLTNSGITTVHFFVIRINSGQLDIRVTTSGGADQIVTCSKLFLWSSPNAGSGATALAVQGTADYEIIMAGS